MKPEIGDTVKIFINSSVIEGRVHKWGKKIILSSDHKDSFMVITKPENIFMYKLTRKVHENNKIEINASTTNDLEVAESSMEDLQEEQGIFHEEYYSDEIKEEDIRIPEWVSDPDKTKNENEVTDSLDSDIELRGKTLAELHKLKIDEERKILAQRMKQAKLNPSLGVKYELPGFFKKQGSE